MVMQLPCHVNASALSAPVAILAGSSEGDKPSLSDRRRRAKPPRPGPLKRPNRSSHGLDCNACLSSPEGGRGFSCVFRHHLLKNQPLSVGFFSPASPSVGTGSGAWPLELAHPQVAIFGVDSAVFCSLFSVALLNIQGQMSCIGAGLRAIGLFFRLLWRTRPKQRKAQKNRFAAACRCGTDVSASLASRRLSTS